MEKRGSRVVNAQAAAGRREVGGSEEGGAKASLPIPVFPPSSFCIILPRDPSVPPSPFISSPPHFFSAAQLAGRMGAGRASREAGAFPPPPHPRSVAGSVAPPAPPPSFLPALRGGGSPNLCGLSWEGGREGEPPHSHFYWRRKISAESRLIGSEQPADLCSADVLPILPWKPSFKGR